ncbi:tRNA 5-methoxyuridine(34)/uridine 5-oxyacetic acid(34) synthase CmoB [Campylobacter sp. LR291e]|uniref:tRNA 5-methoxyuridine(34)/uridine 5-oxyacetic acid(34) synthase CmoB n=1 Tax=unclassified Campylobacter TaxID=2593542 RepID=UPI0012380141|nr:MULTISPECIES: tRNA 5-methoxyuridine(34)/uridine 5-oxyacetic acid(34) synthase CmoB [unclassified Campylobacter]KAA6224696.1 tRNA 5-methoxyuridine(34)/uridine 5-oxyacetic acid(34) synthase CmoB [Campylobacter sp. LR185c]KAA6225814.1 tRNA 5-methoxyuridine(34)/uridine 5-oxyacetic acid(34) synthase CmoB [Campylobacter sp. LR196d]KAA6229667.1 tRNA 5-methoxyuridine(34)/uridine 5-oxyacetic acid(34) synthase CmoB [Campylobacter sp. LR291e]KAA6230087.1 tRNA 5-methoxyuridine(34)/uridine 5-oxyacetic ac
MLENQLLKSPLFKRIQALKECDLNAKFSLSKNVDIAINKDKDKEILDLAKELKPWRKGPFKIGDLFIDSEWQSFIKFDILRPYLDILKDKNVADIGCNNGYYMFKMLEFNPKSITGFDPSIKYRLQFELINSLIKTDIKYELLGVENLPSYEKKFDIIFCLGVIYHRSDPIKMLKDLKKGLNDKGVVFLDTMYIDDEREVALIPRKTYSKISNIYFIPSILALRNWCERAGFVDFEILAKKATSTDEQRKTQWIDSYSLGDFLDPNDSSLTFEGYESPKRVYVKLKV